MTYFKKKKKKMGPIENNFIFSLLYLKIKDFYHRSQFL